MFQERYNVSHFCVYICKISEWHAHKGKSRVGNPSKLVGKLIPYGGL